LIYQLELIFVLMKKRFLQFLLNMVFVLMYSLSYAQDTLPNFTLQDFGNAKIQISWMNPFSNLNQVSIQRSYDSIRFFQTIFSSQSPNLPQNGFIDNLSAPGVKVFYRIFYVKEDGDYAYTKSLPIKTYPTKQSANGNKISVNDKKRINTDKLTAPPEAINNLSNATVAKDKTSEAWFINIYDRNKDSLLYVLEYADYKNFKDSIIKKTKDTIFALNNFEILWKKYIPKYVWKPSPYIFTTTDNYVKLLLPLTKEHRYKVKFFEENGSEIFEIKHVKEDILTLDKTNFIHAGWFFFELFEDENLKEKNKFYLESDF